LEETIFLNRTTLKLGEWTRGSPFSPSFEFSNRDRGKLIKVNKTTKTRGIALGVAIYRVLVVLVDKSKKPN
jgi:hypothetical protein